MAVSCHTVALDGVDARPVEVQCALSPGLPAFSIVGLPDKAVSKTPGTGARGAVCAVHFASLKTDHHQSRPSGSAEERQPF